MNNSKRMLVLEILTLGTLTGGFLFSLFFKWSFLGGAVAGGFVAALILLILSPNIVNEINSNLSEERKTRLAKVQFHGFKRTILHPTLLPAFLGLAWGGPMLLISYLANIKLTNDLMLLSFSPPMFLFGLSGYQMVRRNEYIGKYGNIIHGFPAKLYGYAAIILWWGTGILLVLIVILNW